MNKIPSSELKTKLLECCHSEHWAKCLCDLAPFNDLDDLKEKSENIWNQCKETDWLEAFKAHPQIGDIKTLEAKYASTKETSQSEQAGVKDAQLEVLKALKKYNDDYLKKFGFIFIVCATGKSASEMLELLKSRIDNTRSQELINAKNEQNKITHIRLEKLWLE
jgi:2-oxo-4-hydroxy-4-carboxy-5-ureidoimidazoline decarboxylase